MTRTTRTGTTAGTGWFAPGGLRPDALERGTQELAGYDILVFAVLIVVGVHALSLPFNIDLIREGSLRGPDDYTRMARVRDLLANGWFGPVLERVGDGELQHHWTRPMDAIIAGLYYLFALVLHPRDALYWAGSIASPLIHAGSVVATIAILRKRLSADTLMTLILILLLMPMFYVQFRLGRPDHHGLQIGLMSVMLAVILRMVIDIESARPVHRWAWAAGGMAALLAWGTPGGLLPAMAMLGSVGLLWVLRGGLYANAGLHASTVAVLAALVILPLERGGGFAVLDLDRFSLIHLSVLGFATVIFAPARILENTLASASLRKDIQAALRWSFAVLTGIAGIALAWILLPSLLSAEHFVEIDSFYRETRTARINESQPVFSVNAKSTTELYQSMATLVSSGGLLLLAPLIFALSLFYRPFSWAYLVPPLFIFAAYMVVYRTEYFGFVYKNTGYLSVPLIFIYAGLIGEVTANLRHTIKRGGMLAAIGTKFVAAVWPVGLIFPLALLGGNTSETEPRTADCGLHQVSTELEALARTSSADARILAVPEISSELLHRTDFRVLSIATHRYQPGYRLMHKIFSETDPARAHALMHDHGIAGIVTCDSYSGYFDNADAHFHGQLKGVTAPAGFESLTGPETPVQVHALHREVDVQR